MIRKLFESLVVTTAVMAWVVLVAVIILVAAGSAFKEAAVGKLAVLRFEGEIEGAPSTVGGGPSVTDLLEKIRKIESSTAAKALVLRIDSPGGTPAAARELYDAIRRLRKAGKKVVVSTGDLCASGGYYVACAADRIVANPVTLTGSIGVISGFPEFSELQKKIGIEYHTIKSVPMKDTGSMFRTPTTAEIAYLQSTVDEVHARFVADIAAARGKTTAEIGLLADGRIYTGERALALGLVDELGGMHEALAAARKLAALPADEAPQELNEGPGLLRSLLTLTASSIAGRLTGAGPRLRF